MAMQKLKQVVLDNGVFRRLVEATSRSEVQGLLDIINGMIPLKLVSSFGLWPEYVGLARPPFRYPDGIEAFRALASIDDFNAEQELVFEMLFKLYRADPLLAPSFLEKQALKFMAERVSKNINEARDIAKDIIFFEGQLFNGEQFSWDALANQLSIDYTVDEIFHQIRFLPSSIFDSMTVFVRQIAGTLKEYHDLPIYRLSDSIIEYLWKVHDELPDETSKKAKRTIFEARKGMKQLSEGEFGDCGFLWTAVQGVYTNDGLQPATVISFDKQSEKRVSLMVDLMKGEFRGKSLLSLLRESDQLRSGRILVLTGDTYSVVADIDVALETQPKAAQQLAGNQ